MMFQKSFAILKKRFHALVLLELALWFSLLFFLVYIKQKIMSYLALFNTFAPQLSALGQAAEQNALQNTEALGLLNNLEGLTNEAMFFAFFIVPVVLFLLWCIFQSVSWLLIKDKSVKKGKQFFYKFTAISLVVFVALYLVTRSVVEKMAKGTIPLDTGIAQMLLIIFIGLYFLVTLYACIDDSSLKQILKRFLKVGIKRFYALLIPYVLFFIVSVASLFLFLSLYVSYTIDNYFFLPATSLVLYFLVCLIVSLLLKIFLNVKVAAMK